MKRKLTVVGMIVLAVGTATLLSETGFRAQARPPAGDLLVGTWAWQTSLPVSPGLEMPLPALVTYHIDGTVSVADATMLGGLPAAANPFMYTPGQGVWEHTGHHEFGGTSLYLRFDRSTGILLGILRSRAHIEFGADFDHIKGTMHLDFLSCSSPLTCPDPVSAPPEAWQSFGPVSDFSFTATRLHVVPMPE
jgi:hypothetical protein